MSFLCFEIANAVALPAATATAAPPLFLERSLNLVEDEDGVWSERSDAFVKIDCLDDVEVDDVLLITGDFSCIVDSVVGLRRRFFAERF